MLVSIIIPVYNVSAKRLERCIKSVLDQSVRNIEIIIIDDGSKDSFSCDYSNMCCEYPGIRYLKKENGGPSSARNLGVSIAAGNYIMFLDSDDYLASNCLDEAISMCGNSNSDLIIGYVSKSYSEGDDLVYDNNFEKKYTYIAIEDDVKKAELMNHILGYYVEKYKIDDGYIIDGPVARLFKKELFDNNKFDLVPFWNEDTLWDIALIKLAKNIIVCKSVWYVYDVRYDSVSQGFREKCADEFIYNIEKEYEIGKKMWGDLINKGISYRIWHDIFMLSRMYIFNPQNSAGFLMKYKVLKQSLKNEYYKKAIKNVDFSHESSFAGKLYKKVMKFSMIIHFYLVTYCVLGLYSCFKQRNN